MRVMYNDYIVAYIWDQDIISEITLVLLKDTGWYSVNFEIGKLLCLDTNKAVGFLRRLMLTKEIVISENSVMPKEKGAMCLIISSPRARCRHTIMNLLNITLKIAR